jgi:hypothetical protein
VRSVRVFSFWNHPDADGPTRWRPESASFCWSVAIPFVFVHDFQGGFVHGDLQLVKGLGFAVDGGD